MSHRFLESLPEREHGCAIGQKRFATGTLIVLENDSTAPQPPANENPVRTVWSLAWPAVAVNSLQVINSLLDSGFIGHLPAKDLLAYGGVTNVVFLMFSLAMALSTAATALVSRAYGAGEIQELRQSARQCLNLAVIAGFVIAIIAFATSGLAATTFLPEGQTAARQSMVAYLGIYAAGLPAVYVIQTLAGSLRGVGDTRSPMVISGIQIVLHIALNYVLIFPPRVIGGGIAIPGFNMGLNGAALALSASAWASALGYLAYVPRTKLGSCVGFALPNLDWARRILKIAVPAALMAVLRVASLAMFTIALKLSSTGATAIAAMRPGFAIESIMFMPSFGLSMAAAALVGQSLGMKRPERAEKLAWIAAHHAALVTAALCLPIFMFSNDIARLLIEGKPEISGEAASLLRWLCFTEIFFAYAMVMIGAMQGAGDTKRPLWITVISLWGLRVPLAFGLVLPLAVTFGGNVVHLGANMGPTGAWISMSFTQAIQGMLAIWFFQQGKWKLAKV